MRTVACLLVLLLGTVFSALADERDGRVSRTLSFDVYLDGKPIGYHRFRIENRDAEKQFVHSEARFDVKFLFFTAFRYRHRSSEHWDGNCLVAIEAETDSNDKQTSVAGKLTEAGFALPADDGTELLPDCVMTFAYWNPDFLQQEKLLNPQTGEYVDVEVSKRPEEPVEIGGLELLATPYDIRAKDVEITVWYSPDDEWLALESPAKGDRILRYELS